MSLSDKFADWRNHLIANPTFQAWAVRNPFTRAIAQRKAKTTFDLVAGFVYSQVLAASVESGLIEQARDGPIDPASFASHAGLPPEGAMRLMRAAAALGLLRQRTDGRFALGETGAALLGNPSVFAMIRHHRAFYRDIEDPLQLLRGRRADTEVSKFWIYGPSARPDDAAAYSGLMAETQALVAKSVLEAYDFSRHHTVMDVGGGLGAFLSAVGDAHPELKLVLVDLAAVTPLAEKRLAASPLGHRFRIEPRDMLSEPLPEGADLITLVRVVHDHDDGPVLNLLRSARTALAPGGRLLIAEPMAGLRGAEAMADAYFGFYLWAMGRGAPRRPEEIKNLLLKAEFSEVRQLQTHQPLLVSVVIAR
ncbi:MAG: methyltransferase [Hyphomonas sp.]